MTDAFSKTHTDDHTSGPRIERACERYGRFICDLLLRGLRAR